MTERCLYCGKILTSGDSGSICFRCWYKEDYSKRNNIVEQRTYTMTMNSEPLTNKQLHELIVSQSMTIDRLLTDKGHYMDVMKKLYDDIQALGVWLANQTTQQKG